MKFHPNTLRDRTGRRRLPVMAALLACLIAAALIAACGGGSTETTPPADTPTPVPTDAPTPVPADTLTPMPTDAPTPVPADTPTPVPTDAPTPVPADTPQAQTAISPDRHALVAFYNVTEGDNWANKTNWLSEMPIGHMEWRYNKRPWARHSPVTQRQSTEWRDTVGTGQPLRLATPVTQRQ